MTRQEQASALRTAMMLLHFELDIHDHLRPPDPTDRDDLERWFGRMDATIDTYRAMAALVDQANELDRWGTA